MRISLIKNASHVGEKTISLLLSLAQKIEHGIGESTSMESYTSTSLCEDLERAVEGPHLGAQNVCSTNDKISIRVYGGKMDLKLSYLPAMEINPRLGLKIERRPHLWTGMVKEE